MSVTQGKYLQSSLMEMPTDHHHQNTNIILINKSRLINLKLLAESQHLWYDFLHMMNAPILWLNHRMEKLDKRWLKFLSSIVFDYNS